MSKKGEKRNAKAAYMALSAKGIPMGADFHMLNSEVVLRIRETADAYGYRQSKNANGSTARTFYEYANRAKFD